MLKSFYHDELIEAGVMKQAGVAMPDLFCCCGYNTKDFTHLSG
jgi:hypothetical protein